MIPYDKPVYCESEPLLYEFDIPIFHRYYCLKYENYTNHMFAKKILFVKYYSHKNLFEEKLSFTLLKRLNFLSKLDQFFNFQRGRRLLNYEITKPKQL